MALAERAREQRCPASEKGLADVPHACQVIARVLARQGSGRLCIERLPRSAGGGACGETALHHFLYRATPRAQFVMPAISAPLQLPGLCQVGSCICLCSTSQSSSTQIDCVVTGAF